MGYIRDHAIVVVGSYGDYIVQAHAKAAEIFPWASPVSPEAINGSRSFFIPPDGSKEGWSDSDDGDTRRTRFIEYLLSLRYNDGSSPLSWVEVRVSDDNGKLCIERSYKDKEAADGRRKEVAVDKNKTGLLYQALQRPPNFENLDAQAQWDIDKRLSILDWTPDKEESDEYVRLRKEAGEKR